MMGQVGFDLHASFLQKFPGGESGKDFNFICLLAFSELCMYCPPNLPESLFRLVQLRICLMIPSC